MKSMRAALWTLIIILLLTGCAGNQAPAEMKWMELTYVTNLEDAEQLITLQTPLLEQKGLRLTRLELDGEDDVQALQKLIDAGTIPDLILMKNLNLNTMNQWIQEGKLRTVPAGKIKAKGTLWEHATDWSHLLASQDSWSALPVESWNPDAGDSDMMIYCRIDWARNLGIEDLSSFTWAEFITLARGYAHSDPDNNGEADTWGLTYAGAELGGLENVIYGSFGVEEWIWQEDMLVPGWSSDAARTATEWLVQLRREGILDPNGADHTREEALELFCRGYAGMILWDDPAQLETHWRNVQATRDKAKPINENVTVLALPANPYGVTQMNGNREDAPLALFSVNVNDEALEKLLTVMEDVARLAWKLPDTLADDASFTQRCAYRKRVYYRPYQNNVPSFTQAVGAQELTDANEAQLMAARSSLSKLITAPGNFVQLWTAWEQENENIVGGYRDAVNQWAAER